MWTQPRHLLVAAGLAAACLLGTLAGESLANVTLVQSNEPTAELVVSPGATTTEQFAGREFQQAIELMTQARLPVVAEPTGQQPLAIVLGTPETSDRVRARAGDFADDLEYIGQTDGFAVRLVDQTLYIFATQPKGVLNGVYSFLEENTSILWYRAGDEGVAYQATDRIVAEQVSYRERPAFDLRGWLLTSIWRHTHEPTELWMTRNRATYKPTSRETLADVMPTLIERGMFSEYGGGHNLRFWFPGDDYFEQHPEYFVKIDGVRRPLIGGTRGTQLCFSNEQGREAFTREVLAKMHLVPDGVNAIAILIEDNWNICRCDLCHEPITLPDGSKLTQEDDAFRSTQFFRFLNHVAEAVDREHPGMRVSTFAYIFTAPPPKIPVADNIYVRFCPFVRSDKHTLHEPVNERWLDRINAWTQVTPNIIWREYYGCASRFPRPLARTVTHDLQYISSLGIRSVFSETPPDAEPTRPGRRRLADSWDVSSMQFWIITRLYWDPTLDVVALRQRYLDRVYESAAPAMGRFFDLIEESWYGSSDAEFYNAEAVRLAERYIKQAGIEDACREALDAAAASAGRDVVRERVAVVRAHFDNWMQTIAEHPTPEIVVGPTPPQTEPYDHLLDFDSAIWEQAGVIDGLSVMGQVSTPARERTVVRVMQDDANLYLGFECFSDQQVIAPAAQGAHEQFPRGDRIELFIDGNQRSEGLYYHLAFNAANVKYDGVGYDKSWDGPWSVVTRVDADGWRAVAILPWATLGIDPATDESHPAALFYRLQADRPDAPSQHSSWGGGAVHSAAGFGRLLLQQAEIDD